MAEAVATRLNVPFVIADDITLEKIQDLLVSLTKGEKVNGSKILGTYLKPAELKYTTFLVDFGEAGDLASGYVAEAEVAQLLGSIKYYLLEEKDVKEAARALIGSNDSYRRIFSDSYSQNAQDESIINETARTLLSIVSQLVSEEVAEQQERELSRDVEKIISLIDSNPLQAWLELKTLAERFRETQTGERGVLYNDVYLAVSSVRYVLNYFATKVRKLAEEGKEHFDWLKKEEDPVATLLKLSDNHFIEDASDLIVSPVDTRHGDTESRRIEDFIKLFDEIIKKLAEAKDPKKQETTASSETEDGGGETEDLDTPIKTTQLITVDEARRAIAEDILTNVVKRFSLTALFATRVPPAQLQEAVNLAQQQLRNLPFLDLDEIARVILAATWTEADQIRPFFDQDSKLVINNAQYDQWATSFVEERTGAILQYLASSPPELSEIIEQVVGLLTLENEAEDGTEHQKIEATVQQNVNFKLNDLLQKYRIEKLEDLSALGEIERLDRVRQAGAGYSLFYQNALGVMFADLRLQGIDVYSLSDLAAYPELANLTKLLPNEVESFIAHLSPQELLQLQDPLYRRLLLSRFHTRLKLGQFYQPLLYATVQQYQQTVLAKQKLATIDQLNKDFGIDGADLVNSNRAIEGLILAYDDPTRFIRALNTADKINLVFGTHLPKETDAEKISHLQNLLIDLWDTRYQEIQSTIGVYVSSSEELGPELPEYKPFLDGRRGLGGVVPSPSDDELAEIEAAPSANSSKNLISDMKILSVAMQTMVLNAEAIEAEGLPPELVLADLNLSGQMLARFASVEEPGYSPGRFAARFLSKDYFARFRERYPDKLGASAKDVIKDHIVTTDAAAKAGLTKKGLGSVLSVLSGSQALDTVATKALEDLAVSGAARAIDSVAPGLGATLEAAKKIADQIVGTVLSALGLSKKEQQRLKTVGVATGLATVVGIIVKIVYDTLVLMANSVGAFIGGTVGGIAGFAVGGPAGAVIGAANGAQIGFRVETAVTDAGYSVSGGLKNAFNSLAGAGQNLLSSIANSISSVASSIFNTAFIGKIGQSLFGFVTSSTGALAVTATSAITVVSTVLNYTTVMTALITPESGISEEVSITKTATPDTLSNSQLPTSITYSITITNNTDENITLTDVTDSIQVILNQETRSNDQAPSIPKKTIGDFGLTSGTIIPPGEFPLQAYQVPIDTSFSDSSVSNTITVTYSGKSGSSTTNTTADVCIGKCPQVSENCWPTHGRVVQEPYGQEYCRTTTVDPDWQTHCDGGSTGKYFPDAYDVVNDLGTPIVANVNGTVAFVKNQGTESFGLHIVVTGPQYPILYAHMSRVDVEAGQRVVIGQQLGLSGDTGYSGDNHLHFEVRNRGLGPTSSVESLLRQIYKRPEFTNVSVGEVCRERSGGGGANQVE